MMMKPSDVSIMKHDVKMKLNTKSIKYSLKFIIKGERNTGKTSLFNRLQGLPFKEQYTPTPEIQISHINWDYKNTDDIVDVEIWDIVDIANINNHSSTNTPSLKLQTTKQIHNDTQDSSSFFEETQEKEEDLLNNYLELSKKNGGSINNSKSGSFKIGGLDSKTINVYKNVNAVIFMMDPSKRWTFKYIEKEINKVPFDKPILIISNFRDKNPIGITSLTTGSKQEPNVTYNDINSLINSRSLINENSNSITHIEASMLNAYGLQNIVRFFNIPFLEMQQDSLIQQLQRNKLELQSSKDELSLMLKESNYNNHIKRMQQPTIAPQPNIVHQQQPNTVQTQQSPPSPPINPQQIQTQQSPPSSSVSTSGSFFSRLFSKSNDPIQTQTAPKQVQQVQQVQQSNNNNNYVKPVLPTMPKVLSSVEDFVAGTNDDDDFYNEKTSKTAFIKNIITNVGTTNGKQQKEDRFGSDSDDDDNPWVSKEEDDFYSTKTPTQNKKKQSAPISTKKLDQQTSPKLTSSSIKQQQPQPVVVEQQQKTKSPQQTSPKIVAVEVKPTKKPVINISSALDDFNPFGNSQVEFDDSEDDDEPIATHNNSNKQNKKPIKFNDDESDDDNFNPLVKKNIDDSSDDEHFKTKPKQSTTSPKPIIKKQESKPTVSPTPPKTSPILSPSPKTTITTKEKIKSPKPIKFNDDESDDNTNFNPLVKKNIDDTSDDEDFKSKPRTSTTSPKPIIKKQQESKPTPSPTPPKTSPILSSSPKSIATKDKIKSPKPVKFNNDESDDDDNFNPLVKKNIDDTSDDEDFKFKPKPKPSPSDDNEPNSLVIKDDDYEDFF